MEREDILLVMQREIKEAIKRPTESKQWGMLIDTRKCVGCHACTIGCVAEYKLPPGVVYRPVIEKMEGKYPNIKQSFLPRPCFQCAKPACVPVCPVKATTKQSDGVVAIDYKKCIGCRACISNCPYGARTFDTGEYYTSNTPAVQEYEKAVFYEYGKQWKRDSKHAIIVGSARKCHFCTSRVMQGLLPVCVSTCIGRATYFGDLKDPKSLINQLLKQNKTYRLKEEKGTEPQVFYI